MEAYTRNKILKQIKQQEKPDSLYPFSPSLAAFAHAVFVSTSYYLPSRCKPALEKEKSASSG